MSNDIQPVLDKALNGERLTANDCTALLESKDFVRIGLAADEIRQRKNPGDIVTYIIDRNINYTNVCNVVCTFCAFYRRPGKPDTYVHSIDEICKRIDETISLGGTGVRSTVMNLSHTILPLAFGGVGTALGMAPVFWTMAVALALGAGLAGRRRRQA